MSYQSEKSPVRASSLARGPTYSRCSRFVLSLATLTPPLMVLKLFFQFGHHFLSKSDLLKYANAAG